MIDMRHINRAVGTNMKNPFGESFFKKTKATLPKLLTFFICNLLAIAAGAGLILVVSLFAGIIIQEAAENRFWSDLIFEIGMTLGFVIPFYFKFFVDDRAYRRFYFKKTEEGDSIRDLIKAHCAEYAKYELLLLLAISVIPIAVPEVVLGKTGISFLYSSASFFVFTIPRYFLTGIPILFAKLIGAVCWWLYLVLLYFICLRLAYRKWEKDRLGKSKRRQQE